jgi:hypothetical protein
MGLLVAYFAVFAIKGLSYNIKEVIGIFAPFYLEAFYTLLSSTKPRVCSDV